jgi:DNA polymerase
VRYIVDFETYYDKELSVVTLGLFNYCDQADAYLVSVVCDDFEFCGSPKELREELGTDWMKDSSAEFWAANANFDHAFWTKEFGPTAKPWQCVLDRAAAEQLPRSLGEVSRVVLGSKLDKSIRDNMRGVVFAQLPEAEQQRVTEYCLGDAKATRELLAKLPEMSALEAGAAAQTRRLNRTGVHVDVERAERDRERLQDLKWKTERQLPWTQEEDVAALSYPAFSAQCRRTGTEPPLSLDKRDPLCAAWMKANPEQAKWVEQMRLLRGASTKVKKIEKLLAIQRDGIMPLELLYCGARHTRRWSSKGWNIQNLDREPVFAEELAKAAGFNVEEHDEHVAELGVFLRHYILPPPGHKFAILDYSQIEPRALSWLVDNREMLDAIRAGYGIYEAHAMATMGWRGQAGTLKKTDPQMYQFAKIRVLALGYGMGPALFAKTATAAGIQLTEEQAVEQVRDFRDTNPKLTQFWRKMDELIRHAMLDYEGEDAHTLKVEMPTGEFLRHFQVRGWIKGESRGIESLTIRGDYSQQSRQSRLWGGTLTENVTQRMARDVLADSLLRLERAGFNVVFHAHDEVVLAVPEQGAKDCFEEAKRVMEVAPEWAPDLPLQVEGGLSDTYTKL